MGSHLVPKVMHPTYEFMVDAVSLGKASASCLRLPTIPVSNCSYIVLPAYNLFIISSVRHAHPGCFVSCYKRESRITL